MFNWRSCNYVKEIIARYADTDTCHDDLYFYQRASESECDFLRLEASRLCFLPRINVTPLRSKLKQFFHWISAILIFTWRGQAEDTLVMMKDIFPFSQLGHALTHHYPIDLIHGFPSTSPYLPRPSMSVYLSLPLALCHSLSLPLSFFIFVSF